MNKLGFIGMGNMAQALAAGFIQSGNIDRSKVFALFTSGHKWRIIFPPAAVAAALALLVCFLVTAILLVLYAASPAGLLIRQFSFILLYTLVYGKLLSKKSKTEVKRMIGRKG